MLNLGIRNERVADFIYIKDSFRDIFTPIFRHLRRKWAPMPKNRVKISKSLLYKSLCLHPEELIKRSAPIFSERYSYLFIAGSEETATLNCSKASLNTCLGQAILIRSKWSAPS